MATLFPHRCGTAHNTETQRNRHTVRQLMLPNAEGVTRSDGGMLLVGMQRCAVLPRLRAQTIRGQLNSWPVGVNETGRAERLAQLRALEGVINEA